MPTVENTSACEVYQKEECPSCKKTQQSIEELGKEFSQQSIKLQNVDPAKLWSIVTQHCTPQEKQAIEFHLWTLCLQNLFRRLYGSEGWKDFVARAKEKRK